MEVLLIKPIIKEIEGLSPRPNRLPSTKIEEEPKSGTIEEIAKHHFTSGLTGIQRCVMLTHHNFATSLSGAPADPEVLSGQNG